jgi:hypothetical protein
LLFGVGLSFSYVLLRPPGRGGTGAQRASAEDEAKVMTAQQMAVAMTPATMTCRL